METGFWTLISQSISKQRIDKSQGQMIWQRLWDVLSVPQKDGKEDSLPNVEALREDLPGKNFWNWSFLGGDGHILKKKGLEDRPESN